MDKTQVLQKQKDKLLTQLEEKRRENRELEEKLASLEAKQEEYSQTMLCVNRLWDQFNTDVQTLVSTFESSQQTEASKQEPSAMQVDDTEVKQETKPTDVKLESIKARDPFLGALLAGAESATIQAVHSTSGDIQSEMNDVETMLQARSIESQKALARLLDFLRQHVQNRQPQPQPTESGEQTTSQQLQQLQQHLDAEIARRRVVEEQQRLSQDRLLEASERIRLLESEAADQQEMLMSANRKLTQLQIQHQEQQQQQLQSQQRPVLTRNDSIASGSQPELLGRQSNGNLPFTDQQQANPEDSAAYEELQALLAKRTAELDSEKEAHAATNRLLSEARALVSDDSSWVTGTAAYKAVAAELAAAQDALATRVKEMEALIHDKEAAEAKVADRNLAVMREAQAQARLVEANTRIAQLVASKAQADTALAEAVAALSAEKQRTQGSATTAELQALVEGLQAQLAVKEAQIKQAQVPQDKMAAAMQDIMSLRAMLAEAKVRYDQLTAAHADVISSLADGKKREERLQERIADLQAYVDVLSSIGGINDNNTAVEELASAKGQVAALHTRVLSLQQQLDNSLAGSPAALAAAAESNAAEKLAAAQQQVAVAEGQLAAARAQVEQLDSQLASARLECDMYTTEIEANISEYEQRGAQNTRLMGLLAEKETIVGTLSAERMRLNNMVASLKEAVDGSRADVERLSRELGDARVAREAADREVARLAMEAAQAREQLRHASLRLSAVESDARRREETVTAVRAQLEACQQQLASLRDQLATENEKVGKEKTKRQRLEEDNKALSNKLSKLRKASNGGAGPPGTNELIEELEAMRKELYCSVCHERRKNVIITKCCHVFCDKCIKRNLENRNRKCPGCGIAFGQADVKTFFST